MREEQYICTLEQAKELHALGVDCHSLYMWGCRDKVVDILRTDTVRFFNRNSQLTWYPAYTSTELGVMLPRGVSTLITANGFEVQALKHDFPFPQIEEPWNYFAVWSDFSEAEARACMLIMMIHHKFVSVAEVNKLYREYGRMGL